jgi:NH3-dependent NAD+ synthetase
LAKRLKASNIRNVVIGISGGLDSTHALIVAARTMDLLELRARTSRLTRCLDSPRPEGRTEAPSS